MEGRITLLPRRQEAESQVCMVKGREAPALVTHDEVRAWGEGSRDALICSVSHSWESREHPDPCGHQLRVLASCTALWNYAFLADIWLFYDFVSLFQFKRPTAAQEQSFQRAMANMHVIYAHEFSWTFRIEGLTPASVFAKAHANTDWGVSVYDEPTDSVRSKHLQDLVLNPVEYHEGLKRTQVVVAIPP